MFAIDSAVTTPGALQVIAAPASQVITLTGNKADFARQIGDKLPSDANLLVIDNYATNIDFAQASRAWAPNILVIDDLADRPFDADFLLNQTPGCGTQHYADIVNPDCTLMLGSSFALLRDDITRQRPNAAPKPQFSAPKGARLLISLGATDPDDYSGKLLNIINKNNFTCKVDLVLSSSAPHLAHVAQIAKNMPDVTLHVDTDDMVSLIGNADIAIGAGGTSSLERCCLGLPTVLIETASNQQQTIAALLAAGAGVFAENAEAAIGEVSRLLADPAALSVMAEGAYHLCDGNGLGRVMDTMLSSSSFS